MVYLHSCFFKAMFTKLLMKIPDLRTLNTLHSEKLLGMTIIKKTRYPIFF